MFCIKDTLIFILFDRLDRQLQDIVYKLVVNLEESKSISLLPSRVSKHEQKERLFEVSFLTLSSLK